MALAAQLGAILRAFRGGAELRGQRHSTDPFAGYFTTGGSGVANL